MTKFRKISAFLVALILMAGCTNTYEAEPRRYQEPRFTEDAPIDLKVNRIEVISEFTPTFTRPNVEHLFPISIEKTARLWAKDRLKATDYSSDKIAEFIIKDASVTEEIEKSEKVFYKDRIKYRATLYVVVKVTDPKNLSSAETSIEAWRELAIPADTGIEEKEKYWNGMVHKLFDEFNKRMEQNIYQYLNMYVENNNVIQEYN